MFTIPKRAVTRAVRAPGKGGQPHVFLELECGHQVVRTGRGASVLPQRVSCTRCFVIEPLTPVKARQRRSLPVPITGPATDKVVPFSGTGRRRNGRRGRS